MMDAYSGRHRAAWSVEWKDVRSVVWSDVLLAATMDVALADNLAYARVVKKDEKMDDCAVVLWDARKDTPSAAPSVSFVVLRTAPR